MIKQLAPTLTLLLSLFCCLTQASSHTTLVFGSTPWDNTKSMTHKYQPLMEHVAAQLGLETTFVVTRDYADLEQQLKAGTVDIGFMPASSYVEAKNSMPGLTILARHTDKHPVTGEFRDHYRGMIVTLKSANLKTWADLKNKRFGFTDKNSSSGYRYPVMLMSQQDIQPKNYFSQIFMLQKHPKVTSALVNGAIDAGATWDVHLSRMQKKYGDIFHIIAQTNPIPLAAVVASPHLSRSKAIAVKNLLQNVGNDPLLLTKIRSNGLNSMGWIKADDTQYDSVRKVLAGDNRGPQVKQLVLGIRPSKALYQVNKMWSPILEHLSNELGLPVILQTTGNHQQLIKRMQTGQFDIGVFPAFAYIQAKDQIPQLKYTVTLLKQYADGRVADHYNGVLISLKSSNIKTLSDLQNRRFGFTSISSTSGFLYPSALLISRNMPPAEYFSHTFMLNKHEKVIKSLLSKAIDGGATTDDELFRANQKYGDIFQTLAVTSDIPFDAVTIAPHLTKSHAQKITTALISLGDNAEILQQLKSTRWKYAGFIAKSDQFYDKVRKVRDTMKQVNVQ